MKFRGNFKHILVCKKGDLVSGSLILRKVLDTLESGADVTFPFFVADGKDREWVVRLNKKSITIRRYDNERA